jgi:DNA invertase Pin-like site-specific DNA recombinase
LTGKQAAGRVVPMTLVEAASTKTKKTKRDSRLVVGYLRCSTERQAEANSLPAQEASLKAYCEAQGLTLASVHSDTVSGSTDLDQRPGLQAALAEITHGKASGLLVLRLDRLSRSPTVTNGIEYLLGRLGARLLLVDGANADDPMTALIRSFQAYAASVERQLLKKRTKDALGQLKKAGKRFSRHAPYGFTYENGALVENSDEKTTLAVLLDLRRNLSATETARELEKRGALARNGKPFSPVTVNVIAYRHIGKEACR